MECAVLVRGKYLQMFVGNRHLEILAPHQDHNVAYSIFKEEPDQVTDHFEQFNKDLKLFELLKMVN